jgi:hypothetical protein
MSDPKRAKRDNPADGATLAEADGLGKLNAWTGKGYSDRFYAIYKVRPSSCVLLCLPF